MTTPGTDDRDWSEQLRTAVRETAPGVPDLSPSAREDVWRRVQREYSAPRRARWRSAVAGAAVVGLVGVAGVAAAGALGAFTGRGPVDAEDSRLGGPGERLDPSASDFPEAVEQVTADIDFPNEEARVSAVSWQIDDLSDPAMGASVVSTGALRLWTAGNALCAWSNVWAAASRDGDYVVAGDAAEVILAAHAWPAITDTDPRMSGESEFSWLPELEAAVRAGDLEAARPPLRDHGACLPGLAPELGLGTRW